MRFTIICTSQFGYHLDTWYYMKYLKLKNKNYVCWDYNKERKSLPNVNIKYVTRNGSKIYRFFKFMKESSKTIRGDSDCVFIKYFMFCSVLKLIHPSKHFILDIRTCSVEKNKIINFIFDGILKIETKFFENISIISDSLKNKLHLPNNTYILPLGSEKIGDGLKQFKELRLLYIGTLSNRDLQKTIYGIYNFKGKYPDSKIVFNVVGTGWNNESEEFLKLSNNLQINENIKFHGYIHHDSLSKIISNSNIGISFIPMTDYFDLQPPTKTFEYLQSNLYIIATCTSENKRILHNEYNRSILINDSISDFSNALEYIYLNRTQIELNFDDKDFSMYSWEKITNDLQKYINKVTDH